MKNRSHFQSLKFLITFFLGAAMLSCSSISSNLLKDPVVSTKSFTLSSLSVEQISMNLELFVENPNPIPLKLNQVTYNLNFSGEKVTEGTFSDGLNVPAQGTATVNIPLNFKYSAIGTLITGIFNKSLTKDYELNGAAKFGIFSIPFNKKGEIRLKN